MSDFEIPILPLSPKKSLSWQSWLKKKVIEEKLCNAPGIVLFIVFGIGVAFGIAHFGFLFAVAVLAVVLGIPLIYTIVARPLLGIVVILVMANLLFGIIRMDIGFPMGTVLDGLQVLLIFGFFIKQKQQPYWGRLKGPVSIMILVWISYNILQLANPAAESRLAWLYTIRTVAFVMLMYFVFLYQIRSISFIRTILKIWIGMSFLAAVYACKQEFIGFSDAELQWLLSDPLISDLLLIGGHWRKFSFFSDPVSFSYNMVISSILCISLITGKIRAWKKWALFFLTCFFLFAMLLSGTRGAFVLVPAAMVLLAVLKYNRQVMILTLIAGLVMGFLIFVPTGNPAIQRFQTAFQPSEDASYLLRKSNQKRIQPYILSHPFGGGLGATGAWGQRFAPNSFLASFPPDSGYVRVAVELGWVGLLLYCFLMFTILRTGINYYYRIKDPEMKTYCLAMVLIIFALNIGNYPQEALVQFPNNIYFYLVTALIGVLYQRDKEINQREDAQTK